MIINWNEFFMFSAKLASMRSKDPSTQVGAVIVDNNNKIIASGYNGMPGGKDECFTWQKTDPEDKRRKRLYVTPTVCEKKIEENKDTH